MSEKILLLIILLLTGGIFLVVLFFRTCNRYSGLIPVKEQRCRCIGLVWNPSPGSPADDGPDSDICLGVIVEKIYLDKRLPIDR